MATTTSLNHITYLILNQLRGRSVVTDTITTDQVEQIIVNLRSQLIKQDANKGYSADPYIIQDLGCVELEEVDAGESCIIEAGCTLLRSVKPIPSTIELHNSQLFTRVGPINKGLPGYDYVHYERIPYVLNNKYSKDRVKYYMQNTDGYLYLVVPTNILQVLRFINVQGVFEDPRDAYNFEDCSGTPCYTDDSPFPVKNWMVNTLVKMTVELFLSQESQAPSDNTNNSKNDYSQS